MDYSLEEEEAEHFKGPDSQATVDHDLEEQAKCGRSNPPATKMVVSNARPQPVLAGAPDKVAVGVPSVAV